jgi:hypothetical protein
MAAGTKKADVVLHHVGLLFNKPPEHYGVASQLVVRRL